MTRMRSEEERPALASGNRPRIQPTHQRSSPSQEGSLTLSSPGEQRGTWHHHRRKLRGRTLPRGVTIQGPGGRVAGHSHTQQPRAAPTRGPGGHSKPPPHGNATQRSAPAARGTAARAGPARWAAGRRKGPRRRKCDQH